MLVRYGKIFAADIFNVRGVIVSGFIAISIRLFERVGVSIPHNRLLTTMREVMK